MTIKSVVKKLLDWAILILWFTSGCLIFIFAANIQDMAIGIALLVLMAIGPMAACLLALRNRKRAAQVFLLDGVLATGLLIFLDLQEFAHRDHPLRGLFTTCGFAVVFFAVPGIYWLITARKQWPPYLQRSFSSWTKLAFGMIGLLLLLAGSCWMGLSQIPWGDCNPRFFVAPKYPDTILILPKLSMLTIRAVIHIVDGPWLEQSTNTGEFSDGTRHIPSCHT